MFTLFIILLQFYLTVKYIFKYSISAGFLAGRRPLSKKRYCRVTLLEYRTMALLTFSTASSSLLPLPLHPSLQLHITTTAHRDNPSVTMIPLCSIQTIYIVRSQCFNCKQVLPNTFILCVKNSCWILWAIVYKLNLNKLICSPSLSLNLKTLY